MAQDTEIEPEKKQQQNRQKTEIIVRIFSESYFCLTTICKSVKQSCGLFVFLKLDMRLEQEKKWSLNE